jgi:hypothetical protein
MNLVIGGGRAIAMQSMEQRLAYDGVPCGRFTKAHNTTRSRPDLNLPYGERLPPVIPLAVFRSDAPATDSGECYSSAAIVWCQDDFGLPDERTLAALRKLDWPAVAVDWTP